jgi:DNA repair protein RecO (recombination protein O)
MQAKTKALVLGTVKYGETSLIVQAYTEVFGWQSYLVQGARTGKSKGSKVALFQALTFLELDVQYAPTRDLQRIADVKLAYPYRSLPFDMKKATVGLFLAEILNKLLREADGEEKLFAFLMQSFAHFDEATEQYENFHLQLLLGLAAYIGISLEDIDAIDESFDFVIPEEVKEALYTLQSGVYLPLSGRTRSLLLDLLIQFYRQHLGGSWEIRSLPVLQALWQ